MAINNYFDNSDINIYFHMKNHYKKLKNARSTIDNSLPQGFIKSPFTPPNSERSLKRTNFDERDKKNSHSSSTHRSGIIKKHNCIATSASRTSNLSINTINLPLRPSSGLPFKMKYVPTRSQSTDSTRRKGACTRLIKAARKKKNVDKGCNIAKNKSESALNKLDNDMLYDRLTVGEPEKSDTNQSIVSKEAEEKCNKSHRLEEHEYLQFLLRITENIIINNVYTNEDIEKVFQTHIEANKDHLNVEKMEAQLARLCVELQIPYKNIEMNSEDLERYEHFFGSYSSDHNEELEDCECSTKRILDIRHNENKEKKDESERHLESTDIYLKKICDVLANRCSLGRVTECTEPNSSVDELIDCMKQLSNTNAHSEEHCTVLSCFKSLGVGKEYSKETLYPSNDDMPIETEEKNFVSDDNLTVKEKIGCMEEDIIFEKHSSNNLIHEDEHTCFKEPENLNSGSRINTNMDTKQFSVNISVANIKMKNLVTQTIGGVDIQSDSHLDILDKVNKLETLDTTSPRTQENHEVDCSNNDRVKNLRNSFSLQKHEENEINFVANDTLSRKGNIQNNKVITVIANENISSREIENIEEIYRNSLSQKNDENQVSCVSNDRPLINESIADVKERTIVDSNKKLAEVAKCIPNIVSNDQCTQIEIPHTDKESNTSLMLDDHPKSDYVLVNGPVYVLKTVLNSEDKLIIYDKDNVGINVGKATDHTACDEKAEPLHYNIIPVPETQPSTDYVSGLCIQEDFAKLLSSDYDLMPQRDSDTSNKYHHLLVDATTSISNVNLNGPINNTLADSNALLLSDKYELIGKFHKEANLIPETDNIAKHSFLNRTNFNFENKLYMNDQYELKNYLPRKVKNSLNIVGSSDDKIEAPTREEIPNFDVSLTNCESYSRKNEKNVITADLSESGEIVRTDNCTDEELSQVSTFRSDSERSSNLSPNRHILGGKSNSKEIKEEICKKICEKNIENILSENTEYYKTCSFRLIPSETRKEAAEPSAKPLTEHNSVISKNSSNRSEKRFIKTNSKDGKENESKWSVSSREGKCCPTISLVVNRKKLEQVAQIAIESALNHNSDNKPENNGKDENKSDPWKYICQPGKACPSFVEPQNKKESATAAVSVNPIMSHKGSEKSELTGTQVSVQPSLSTEPSKTVEKSSATNQDIQNPSTEIRTTDLSQKTNQQSSSILSYKVDGENELDKWKRNCQDGVYSLQSLVDKCETDPNAVLATFKVSLGTDRKLPNGSFEATNEQEHGFLMEKIHGTKLGNPEYHLLMVDATTSFHKIDLPHQIVAPTESVYSTPYDAVEVVEQVIIPEQDQYKTFTPPPQAKSEESIPEVLELPQKLHMAQQALQAQPPVPSQSEFSQSNKSESKQSQQSKTVQPEPISEEPEPPKERKSNIALNEKGTPQEPITDEDKKKRRPSGVSWRAMSAPKETESTASLDQVVKDATAKAQTFRQNLDAKRQHSLLDIVKRKSGGSEPIEESKPPSPPPPKKKKFFNFKCLEKKKQPEKPKEEVNSDSEDDDSIDEQNKKPPHSSPMYDNYRRRNTSFIDNPVFEKKKELNQFLNNI